MMAVRWKFLCFEQNRVDTILTIGRANDRFFVADFARLRKSMKFKEVLGNFMKSNEGDG